jgi:hypothetical protein
LTAIIFAVGSQAAENNLFLVVELWASKIKPIFGGKGPIFGDKGRRK